MQTPGPNDTRARPSKCRGRSDRVHVPTMTSRTPAELPACGRADALRLTKLGYCHDKCTLGCTRRSFRQAWPRRRTPGALLCAQTICGTPPKPKQGYNNKDTRNLVLHWVTWDFARKTNTKLILLLAMTTPRKSTVVFTRDVEHGIRSWGTSSAASPPLAQGTSRSLDRQVQFFSVLCELPPLA